MSFQIRGTAMNASSTNSIAMSFPAGTVAGDLAILCSASGFSVTGPTASGWATLGSFGPALFFNGAAYSKVLQSSDIATGSVTVNFGGTFDQVTALVTFVGGTNGVRETIGTRTVNPGSSADTVSTSSGVVPADTLVYYGANRANSTDTVNRGTQQRQVNDGGSGSGSLYLETGASGVTSPQFSYSSQGSGSLSIVVVVQTTSPSSGVVPKIMFHRRMQCC